MDCEPAEGDGGRRVRRRHRDDRGEAIPHGVDRGVPCSATSGMHRMLSQEIPPEPERVAPESAFGADSSCNVTGSRFPNMRSRARVTDRARMPGVARPPTCGTLLMPTPANRPGSTGWIEHRCIDLVRGGAHWPCLSRESPEASFFGRTSSWTGATPITP